MMVEWQLTLRNMSNIFSFTSSSHSHPIISYLFWTVLQKSNHQSQQLALQSSFPECMVVLSVMTTSLSTMKWRAKSRKISWICPPTLFLLLGLLCFTPMFYTTFSFLIFIFLMYYCQVIHMKMQKSLLLLLLLPSCNFNYLLWTSYVVFTKVTLKQLSENNKINVEKL